MLANSYPPSEGERVLPYGGRMVIKRRRARGGATRSLETDTRKGRLGG